MFQKLPPAGEEIRLAGDNAPQLVERILPAVRTHYFQSGTAALAGALLAARERRGIAAGGEVLVPAYACPALVSAADHIGVTPKLVDFSPGRPLMDVGSIEASITANTIAVIAVDFLGIRERIGEISERVGRHGVSVIEDSAQRLECNVQEERADFIVYSFGRGKPVSVLSGGAIVARTGELAKLVRPPPVRETRVDRGIWKLKIHAYNRLRSPHLFWLVGKIPFSELGKTKYEPLEEISGMPDAYRRVLNVNLAQYCVRSATAQMWLHGLCREFESVGLVDISFKLNQHGSRLLRFPFLVATREIRDRLYLSLERRGVGVTRMYPACLNRLDGLQRRFEGDAFPNAEEFAGKLLTLPTHAMVSRKTVEEIGTVIKDTLGGMKF